ncbi:hypothetical protein SAMN04487857_102177 [Pseudomonas sp. ok272]|uniref:hypothetical protein n=1 Tax=unclassified Pseudomonas TaxID=196821 RepID=UPI0008D6A110|nr:MULTISPECIES: hypothetical protein [unclassified Pseudomonas]SEM47510.1 hypothetical protein SAMN04487857_102177 [Pseudomonas sp. ok272]SFM19120.1 hypothetical protein SAMN04487858_101178 [Pseudomonas sp. ok602]
MNWFERMSWRRRGVWLAAIGVVAWAAIGALPEKEIALVMGEPWEDMRQRSSAKIGPAIAGHHWFSIPRSDARLRLIDPQYGFVTPQARFFTINFNSDERATGVRMSPQVEPLLLDDTLKVILDLQAQWHQGGWTVTRPDFPAIADTPQWRAQLRNVRRGGTTYWQAGDQYQVMLVVHRFEDDRHPTQERYLITLGLGRPWVKP